MRKNAFVKVSGNLLGKREVIEWLRKVSKNYFIVICIGGGEQINEAFRKKDFSIKFGPLGRITKSLEEKQFARDILERNQTLVQDLIDGEGISAQVVIPIRDIASVLCHENGDLMILSAYNGFDKCFILTLKERVVKKKLWLKQLAKCFSYIGEGKLDKIEVVGF